jgi:hypothetical protein
MTDTWVVPEASTRPVSPARLAEIDRTYRIFNYDAKFLYACFLLHVPAREIRSFFAESPLTMDGRTLGEAELLRHIWNENALSPVRWNFGLVKRIEPFLLANDVSILNLFEWGYQALGRGTSFPPRHILWTFQKLLHWLYRGMDPRELLFRHMRAITAKAHPGMYQVPIKRYTVGHNRHCVFAFYPGKPDDIHTIPAWEVAVFVMARLKFSPTRFGAAPFDGWQMIAERQTVHELAEPDCKPEIRDGTLYLNREPYGSVGTFNDILRRDALKLPRDLPVADRPVVIMNHDWFCPRRRRIVLHQGCAYGAPIYLYRMWYDLATRQTREPLEDVLQENLAGPNALWREAERRHLALLAAIEGEAALTFVFDSGSQEVHLGTTVLARSANALLLRRLLSEHCLRGHTLFERKEFIYDREICPDRKRPNLEIRMTRLQSALAQHCPAVSISKAGRGRYALQVTATIRIDTV